VVSEESLVVNTVATVLEVCAAVLPFLAFPAIVAVLRKVSLIRYAAACASWVGALTIGQLALGCLAARFRGIALDGGWDLEGAGSMLIVFGIPYVVVSLIGWRLGPRAGRVPVYFWGSLAYVFLIFAGMFACWMIGWLGRYV
jgi:hypothetical protein